MPRFQVGLKMLEEKCLLDMKKKFISAHMSVAEVYAQLSSATRLKVGCVVVKNDTIIGIGYNGMPSGWDNVCEEVVDVPVTDPRYDYNNFTKELKTKPEVIHAEINAISKIAKSTNSSEGATMFITHAPCIECAKSIYQSGINSVFYRDTYRTDQGVKFLEKCGVTVERIKEE
jgi:dCMP deaminase